MRERHVASWDGGEREREKDRAAISLWPLISYGAAIMVRAALSLARPGQP